MTSSRPKESTRVPAAERTSNRPAAMKSSRTTLLSSFDFRSEHPRVSTNAARGSVAKTPCFPAKHFRSDSDNGRDRTIKAQFGLMSIGNYPGLQHEIAHVLDVTVQITNQG